MLSHSAPGGMRACSLLNSADSSRNLSVMASNSEIKIVNAALASLHDLLAALSGIARTIMRMQAHRAVQTSDNKYFAELTAEEDEHQSCGDCVNSNAI